MAIDNQISYYQALIKLHGATPEIVGWGSRQSQAMRFEVMRQELDFPSSTVLDVGCGRGDLLAYLSKHGAAPKNYSGMDIVDKMVEIAQQLHPGASFTCGDFSDQNIQITGADYVVSSGLFNLVMEDHENWMEQLIVRMYKLAGVSAAFNVISHLADEHKAGFYYADPTRWLSFCLTLTPYVRVRHDYAKHDLTFFLFNKQQRLSVD